MIPNLSPYTQSQNSGTGYQAKVEGGRYKVKEPCRADDMGGSNTNDEKQSAGGEGSKHTGR